MIYSWLKLSCLLGLGITTNSSHAQEIASYSRPQVQFPEPVYVLNSTIIINGVLDKIAPQEIKSVEVYKGNVSLHTERIPLQLQNLGTAGVLNITSPKHIKSHSFAQLGRQLGLRGPLSFAINGHFLDPQTVAALRIAPAAIGQLHILRPTPEAPKTRVDIWLTLSPKPDSSKYPPGTIFIR